MRLAIDVSQLAGPDKSVSSNAIAERLLREIEGADWANAGLVENFRQDVGAQKKTGLCLQDIPDHDLK